MPEEVRMQEMVTLKTIAETLNTSNDLSLMLDTVVGKLLELTGLTAGWLFLINERGEYTCVSDYNLPLALMRNDKEPMRVGTCWCVNRFRDGRLQYAVNIINCKRLEDAVEFQWGDTADITHHATVPLRSGERMLGLLNVAAPGKQHFSDNELALLQAVAYQIGSAMERMRLYRAEQRRADLYARLGDFGSALSLRVNECTEADALPCTVAELLGKHFDWPFAALMQQTQGTFHLQAMYAEGKVWMDSGASFSKEGIHLLDRIVDHYRAAMLSADELIEMFSSCTAGTKCYELSSGIGVPIPYHTPGEPGVLVIATGVRSSNLLRADSEVLEALAEHIVAAKESLKLADHRRELARLEERNRLARDLHDSVNQILFSLSLTARGAESMFPGTEPLHPAAEAMKDIRALSQEALKEMRALIMQLRPAGLEGGLLSALQEYGARQGLQVIADRKGLRAIPRSVEEGLWRIGQEALNNVRKHAGVTSANILLEFNEHEAKLTISDRGKGGAKRRKPASESSLGLSIMRERAQSLGGKLDIWSSTRKGTTIAAVIPIPFESE
ncbi:GAF domain-containing sensor histidine kinase [Paenibacillus silvae]|uniref:histidine kinase n=1 Tax=Paenibacillus silvae TaxID=1325358 RepID=A0ABQ1ZCT8_9BACL|nr:GAF domain-containing sensor histidine kinase [Paenibacillus silvae]MCK6077875.1 GAF domain-containing sensor histidine kinase [Paenibacillus silvae]MCK6152074.1 GAF domain-containing sensor histidine kinase [Paenibacillus silvae]MCK6270759.1 GAF domain-containing sensor histidine kinase [Paenibacillus silvae]GGH56685.1 histidine kinase [Paenibacillus silvae]